MEPGAPGPPPHSAPSPFPHDTPRMNPLTLQRPVGVSAPERPGENAGRVGLVLAVLFASTSVAVGVLWDISWHQSIGRDTFWSPPHLAIYLGGVVAGVACGWYVLHTTFAGLPADREISVTFWRYFHGPLGAWLCIWGAIAMLTSAPFDDWWHNAYGLDVKILSPPHAVLAMGILAIQLGALFMVLAMQNREEDGRGGAGTRERHYRRMFNYAGGMVLLNFAVVITEYTHRVFQHSTLFYQITAGVFLLPLVAVALAGRSRWPATTAAATYTGVLLTLHFVLPLFPSEPLLAPIRFQLDRMLPPQFPLLLVVPAVGVDLLVRRWGAHPGRWRLAGGLALAFLLTFLAVQWPFADFLQSDLARNAIFKQDLRPYMVGETSYVATGQFLNPAGGTELLRGLAVALGLGVVSARIGLSCGRWMAGVRR
jgi:hypothetical protein